MTNEELKEQEIKQLKEALTWATETIWLKLADSDSEIAEQIRVKFGLEKLGG